MNRYKVFVSIAITVLLSSCARDRISNEVNSAPSMIASMSELEAPAHFDWRSTEERTFILSLGNQAPSSSKYRLEWYIEHPSTGADMRHVALIDKSNPFVGKVTLPKYAEKVFLKLITPEAQSSILEFAASPTTSHTFFSGKRNMKMSAITSITQMGADIDGESPHDLSGIAISFSDDGKRLAIGAEWNNGNGTDAGHARMYEWDGNSWVQLGNELNGSHAHERFGNSVHFSSDGNRIAIGAHKNNANGSHSGKARVYDWNGSSWAQVGADITGNAWDNLGKAVRLSSDGNRLAVAAQGHDGNGSNSGMVRIYQWNGSSWNQIGGDIYGEAAEDQSGYSIDLSADGLTVAIGGVYNDGNGGGAGHVRVYSYNSSTEAWNQMGSDIDGSASKDYFGRFVALSSDGSRFVAGAIQNKSQANGYARVYQWTGSNWSQLGSDINGESDGDFFGVNVAMNGAGDRIVVGARYNDGSANNAGHARVFDWDGASWTQVGSDIDGENAGDHSGYFTNISSDGRFVAVGAPYNHGSTGYRSGHVRTYALGNYTPTDSDGDGVANTSDDYPNDAARAYDSFSPSENSYGTALFEDLWPYEGDYDFNDLVVNFRTQSVSNAENKIVEIKFKLVKMARGGSLESGAGIQLGTVPSSKIASVSGCQHFGVASIGANGAENDQTYANIIFWDKISEAWPNATGNSMQNTISSNPHSAEDTTEVTVTFTEAIAASLIDWNYYIFINGERGRELHAAGHAATDLVDPSYFGTGSDNSDPNDVTTMYKGNGNRPWALEIYSETSHTEEKVDFTEAYLKFSDWALSSGGSYNDWYQDEAGYRGSSSKFYTK